MQLWTDWHQSSVTKRCWLSWFSLPGIISVRINEYVLFAILWCHKLATALANMTENTSSPYLEPVRLSSKRVKRNIQRSADVQLCIGIFLSRMSQRDFTPGWIKEGSLFMGKKSQTSSNMQSLSHKPGAHLAALIYPPQYTCVWETAIAQHMLGFLPQLGSLLGKLIHIGQRGWGGGRGGFINCSKHLESDTWKFQKRFLTFRPACPGSPSGPNIPGSPWKSKDADSINKTFITTMSIIYDKLHTCGWY